MTKIAFFTIILLLKLPILSQNPSSVDIYDPVYDYLDRMETLGYLNHYLNGVKPLSRSKIASFLLQVNTKRVQLSAIDARKLDDFLLDYRFEIDPTEKHALIPDKQNWYSTLASWENFKNDFSRVIERHNPEEENHVLIWEEDSTNFYFDFEQYFTYDSRSDNVSRNANEQSYLLRGTIDNSFAYNVKISLQAVRGSKGYRDLDPLIKGTFTPGTYGPEKAFLDRSSGELAWATKYMNIVFAQQSVSWGYGESGKLILSDYPEQYPYLQIYKNWGWGRFSAMHGKLLSFAQDTLAHGNPFYPDKWVAAHRLELSLWNSFTVGLNEVFIYGNRYADWAYLIPFNFYRATQHKLRDRDNATISLDFEYLATPGLKLYSTVFLDEMSFEKLGTNWWGNKHAFQGGFVLFDPAGFSNLRITGEYTAIMPWVYTHKYDINRYESDKRSLGHWAGPNSEVFYFDIRKDIHARLFAGIKWQQYKHGANYTNENIGGDLLVGERILLPGQTERRTTRKFLEGILSTITTTELYAQYEIFNDLFVSASYIWSNSEMEKNTTNLNEFHFGFLFKY